VPYRLLSDIKTKKTEPELQSSEEGDVNVKGNQPMSRNPFFTAKKKASSAFWNAVCLLRTGKRGGIERKETVPT